MDIYGMSIDDNDPNHQQWSRVYLHGQLEDLNGFDLCYTFDQKPVDDTRKSVKVHIGNQHIDGTLFFWNAKGLSWGLVVANDDEEGFQYALKKYNERAFIL